MSFIQKSLSRFAEYSPASRRFFYTIFALGFALDGVYGVLLNLYLEHLGYDERLIGQVLSVGLLTFALVSLPSGTLGTWLGSLRVLRFGAAIIFLGMLLLPFGEFVPLEWRELAFMSTYALILAGFSLYYVNAAPFLMANVEPHQQNSVFSTQNGLQVLAAFVGSLLAGFVPFLLVSILNSNPDTPEPYRYTLLLVAGISFVSFLIAMSIKAPKQGYPTEQKVKLESTEKPKGMGFSQAVINLIILMSVIRFLQVAGLGILSNFFNLYMVSRLDVPLEIYGIVAAMGRLVAVPTVLFAPLMMRRSSTASVAFWASLATGIALLPIALVPNWIVASLAYICAVALTNLRFTAFLLYIMKLVPAQQQGVMAGAGEMAAGFSFSLMALLGGYIITDYSYRELFLLGFILTSLGSLMFWGYASRANAPQAVALETKV